jgi:pilus assembly protein CpaB
VAIVMGLAAMLMIRNVLARKNVGAAPEAGTMIVVVNKDLPAGAPLTLADLGTTKIVGEINDSVVFRDPAVLDGRVLTLPLIAGTPVIETVLAPKGTGSGLQALIPEGMRAITIEISETSGLAGNLTPGCRVDVVTTLQDENNEMISRTVVQNVKVQSLGMRQRAENDPAPTKSVTLLATARQAEEIELAAASGRPRLVLRNPGDEEETLTEGVTVAELRGSLRRGGDPFLPVSQILPVYQPPVQTVPTTQQASTPSTGTQTATVAATTATPRPAQRVRHRRQITIIRGGVESNVLVEEVASPYNTRWMTNVGSDELPASDE